MLNVSEISRYHGYNCALTYPDGVLSAPVISAHAACGCSVRVRPRAAKHQPQHMLRDDAALLCGPVQSNTSPSPCCVMMQRSCAAPCSQTPAPAHAVCGCATRNPNNPNNAKRLKVRPECAHFCWSRKIATSINTMLAFFRGRRPKSVTSNLTKHLTLGARPDLVVNGRKCKSVSSLS